MDFLLIEICCACGKKIIIFWMFLFITLNAQESKYGLWLGCLTSLSSIFQLFVAVSFIGGGNRSENKYDK